MLPNNDLTGLLVDTLSINDQSATNNFWMTGNAISLAGGVTIDGDRLGSPGTQMDLDGITLTAPQTIDVNMAYMPWQTPIDLQSHTLTFQGNNTSINGVISGSGDLVFNSGTTFLNAANDVYRTNHHRRINCDPAVGRPTGHCGDRHGWTGRWPAHLSAQHDQCGRSRHLR